MRTVPRASFGPVRENRTDDRPPRATAHPARLRRATQGHSSVSTDRCRRGIRGCDPGPDARCALIDLRGLFALKGEGPQPRGLRPQLHWSAYRCAAPPQLLGEGGNELAAEGGDVGHDAAPDRVGGARKTTEHASGCPLRRFRKLRVSGWCAYGCGAGPRGGESADARTTTAFGYARASRGNAEVGLPCEIGA